MAQVNEIVKEPASSEIGSRPWLVSHETRAFFDAWQKGELPAQQSTYFFTGYSTYELSKQPGPIAVLFCGDMLYRSYYPESGAQGLCSVIKQLDADDSVGVIIIRASVWGGDEGSAARVNDALLACTKPVMFYIDYGGATSAGYLMATACKGGIWAARPTDRVGSIGSYLTYYVAGDKGDSWSGMKAVEVYSSLSPKKNEDAREVAKGNLAPAIETADTITRAFHAAIKANRPGIKKTKETDPFEGAIYMASEAIELGMIDGICSWEQMLQKAADLIPSNSSHVTNFSTNMLGLMRSPVLAAMLAATAETITDEQLDAVNAELSKDRNHGLLLVKQTDFDAALSAGNKGDEGQLSAIQGQLTAANQKVTTHEATIASLNAQIVTLKAATPGAEPTTLIKKEESISGTEGKLTVKEMITSETDDLLAQMKAGIPVIK